MIKSYNKFKKTKENNITTYAILIEDLENLYKHFHISLQYIIDDEKNKKMTFRIRIPSEPYKDYDGNIIEDDFTKRISLSDSVKKCLLALPNDVNNGMLYLYGIDLKKDNSDDIETISLKKMINKCPVIKGKKYGEDFKLFDWLDSLSKEDYENIKKFTYEDMTNDLPDIKNEVSYDEFEMKDFIITPSDLPNKYRKMFFACVPDADKTNEFWSLNNLKMDYLGIIYDINDKYVYLKVENDNDIPAVIKNLIKSN
jgi:hypothetical protein